MVLGLADVTETRLVHDASSPGRRQTSESTTFPFPGEAASALLALSSGRLNCCISAFNIRLSMSSFCLKQQINTNYSGLPVSLSLCGCLSPSLRLRMRAAPQYFRVVCRCEDSVGTPRRVSPAGKSSVPVSKTLPAPRSCLPGPQAPPCGSLLPLKPLLGA